ncbi:MULTISPECIES: KGG domain-containing protein [Hymenobacter]|uniref:Stress-induced acidophilic repeat motif-containing protein n=1 Tax=Hymenobacter mucosus TaxID=1411120 RepID=A0A238XS67_9BACT|nr:MULTISPECIES: KGG domain-containing protein [Hymenobacter]SNR61886.1 Stress-induced acidophilic repeat motif-containing protein [Hymenobacter mucosus]
MNTNRTSTTSRSTSPAETPAPKRPRGFAAMDPAQQRRIASEGGRASHQSGRGHRFTSEEARAAGRKGGQASRGRGNQGTAVS